MRHMLAATALQTLFLAAAATFNASFLRRVHGLSLAETGLALGLIAGILGGLSVLVAGMLADRLGLRDLRWHWWLPALGAIVSIPFSVVAYTTSEPRLAVAGIALATLCAAMAMSAAVPATIRVQSNHHNHICEVYITNDNQHGTRVMYRGPLKRGQFKTFSAGDGTTVCVYRNQVPERCNSPMVGPKCRTDSHSNRTILFSID